jgi:hypothetical protein
MMREFDGLRQSVFRSADNSQPLARQVQPLMMMTVRAEFDSRGDACNARARLQMDNVIFGGLLTPRLVMVQSSWKILWDVPVQRAAEPHIDELETPADAQKRFAVPNGCLQELELQGITGRIHALACTLVPAAIAPRLNIASSREKDSIKARIGIDPVAGRHFRWDNKRQAAGPQDCLSVGVAHNSGGLTPLVLPFAGRNADDRGH